MSYGKPVQAYREAEVLSASPGRLLIITYDSLLSAMNRARVGIAMRNHDVALAGLDKSREFLAELLCTLDHEQGGDMAMRLSALYAFVLRELTDIGVSHDTARLDRNIRIIRELRDAFAQVATATRPAAVA